MRVVSVISFKGGTAKTTTSGVLAVGLAERGHKVLLVDANQQGDLTDTFGGSASVGGVIDLLTGTPVEKLIQATNTLRVSLIAGSQGVARAGELIEEKGTARAEILSRALRPVRREYRYCVIDSPGAFDITFLNALAVSDDVIITALPEYYSVKNVGELIRNIRFVKETLNHKINVAGILLTRYQGRKNLTKDTESALREAESVLGTRVFQTHIRENSKVGEAPARRQTILTYDARSNGAIDYRNFIDEYLQGVNK